MSLISPWISSHLKEDPIAGKATAAWRQTLVHGEAGNLNYMKHTKNTIITGRP